MLFKVWSRPTSEAPGRGLALPLDVRGTAFQQRVWMALREIPPGDLDAQGWSVLPDLIRLPASGHHFP